MLTNYIVASDITTKEGNSTEKTFPQEPLLRERDRRVDASPKSTMLTSGLMVIYSQYQHYLHLPLLHSFHTPHSAAIYLEWFLRLVVGEH